MYVCIVYTVYAQMIVSLSCTRLGARNIGPFSKPLQLLYFALACADIEVNFIHSVYLGTQIGIWRVEGCLLPPL